MKVLALLLLGVASVAISDVVPVRAETSDQIDSEQNPVRTARPPADAPHLRPIVDPVGIDRRDLVDGVLPPTMLEGTWELTDSRIRGLRDRGVRGAMIATRTHLVVYLQFVQNGKIRVQSSWRRYRFERGDLVMTSVAGHSDLDDGDVKHELPGFEDRRTLRSMGTRIRLERADDDFMEFLRVE